ncbi:restriction endonuclease subunit S [Acidithiobacillus ferriphilus]|uniref:restriction endonuclease subunit S n=1 Tax=Acidithiobacillus ferriphilus TaxID=1689834 RepID=UPI001C07B96C|nr:restriction endonuclease subunit S [Acidithiobacillus ferriphilus]MBU2830262.1 restriction endonuclease subunit S [Acidithiobacillus ferriphilus]MBU2831666.1 restriction endonuclease subunit S [Acidithiobacillus ferriphilus]
MTSKNKTTATKEEAKPTLVPKLRFPEFRGAEGWAPEPMGEVYSFKGNNSLSRDKLNYVAGSVKNIHYGDIHTKFSTHFDVTKELVPFINESEEGIVRDENLCAEGDMIFADASEDLADIGKSIEIVRLNGERVISGLHTILARRIGERISLGFGGHLFKSGWVRTQIQKEAQGAKVLGISPTRLRNLRLPLPHDKAEQQKIAECLSSVDELMAAQARKVDALKTHKKGLMQQLFPREGETQPRLRFPEFQNAGEWDDQSIGDFGQVVTGSTPSTAQPAFYGGGVPFVSPADISDLRFVDQTKTTLTPEGFAETRPIRAGSVLFVCIGSTIGKVAKNVHECATNQQINAIVPSSKHSDDFVYFALSYASERIALLAGRQAVPIINKSLFSSVRLLVPKLPEQQRIASCLSSLDALITAETQKLEVLKTHKKGLMQQLFPSPDSDHWH